MMVMVMVAVVVVEVERNGLEFKVSSKKGGGSGVELNTNETGKF